MATSPTVIISIDGLGKNLGLDNSKFSNLSNPDNPMKKYLDINLISRARAAITAANLPTLGANLIPGLTGVVPQAYAGSLSPVGNLTAVIANRSASLLTTADLSRFAQFFLIALGYSSQLTSVYKDVDAINKTDLENYGASVTGLSDASTAGISGLVEPKTSENLKNLSQDLVDLGKIFDLQDLTLVGTARGLIKQISATNLQENLAIADAFRRVKISRVDYNDPNIESICYDILTTIPVSPDFQSAFETSLDNSKVVSLADILDKSKSLPRSSSSTTFNDFADLSTKLVVFPKLTATNSRDFGNVVGQLVTPGSLNDIDGLTTPLPEGTLASLQTTYGAGSGIYGNPTMIDLMGSVAGLRCVELFDRISEAVRYIENTSYASLLIADYDAIVTESAEPVPDPVIIADKVASIESTMQSMLADSSLILQENLAALTTEYDRAAAQIKNELEISAKADLNTGVFVPNNKNTLLAFGRSIESFGIDQDQIGTRDILKAITTPDIYGQAILASLESGANRTALTSQGLVPKVLT